MYYTLYTYNGVQRNWSEISVGLTVTEASSAVPQGSLGSLMRVICVAVRFFMNIYVLPLYLLVELLKGLYELGMKCIECDPHTAMLGDSSIHLVNVNIYGASTMWQAVVEDGQWSC